MERNNFSKEKEYKADNSAAVDKFNTILCHWPEINNVNANHKIPAIKEVRTVFDKCGLLEAKWAVENVELARQYLRQKGTLSGFTIHAINYILNKKHEIS